MEIDRDKLMEFLHRFVGDLGATMAAGNVLVGDRLGLYRALAGQPLQPHELAERTGTVTRYVDEWLRARRPGATWSMTRRPGRTHSPRNRRSR
jgi:hypothetical protein